MASFKILDEQENRVCNIPFMDNKANVQVNYQKRAVLGAIGNQPERIAKAKQPFGVHNAQNVEQKSFDTNACTKPQAAVIPVAQFQAFKVYEDNNEENEGIKLNDYKNMREVFDNFYKGTAGEKLVTKKQALEQSGMLKNLEKPKTLNVSMTIENEEPAEKSENVEILAVSNNCLNEIFALEEYQKDIYTYLCQREKDRGARPHYMRKQPDISNNMRTILVDWLVEVSEEYKLQTETLYLAINYIDRFLSFMSVVRAKLQLVGTAAMFIAAKYEEIYPPDVNEFVYITDDTYTKRQVIRMEVLILKVLDFDLSTPTAYTFITVLSVSNRLPDKVTFLAQYLSELALLEAEPTLEILPSVMACAAVAVARNALGEQPWSSNLCESSGYKLSDLRVAVEYLTKIHKLARQLPQQAIQEKYKQGKYLCASTISPADHEIIFDV